MSSAGVTAPPEPIIGRQTPTQELRCNAGDTYEGDRAIALAKLVGLNLDPWQQHLLRESMGVDHETGLWSAFEVCWIVSRQNGKSTALFARALAGLFLLRERSITWTAHRYDTAMDAFATMVRLIKETPELRQELAQTRNEGISTTHGDESITLRTGQKIRFKTRTEDGGRGLGGDLVIIDEVQDAKLNQMAALLPTLGAKPNPQVIYAGSAGGPRSSVLGNLVHRALGSDASVQLRLYFAQWAADEGDDPAAPETWAKANPSLGIHLAIETMAGFYRQWRFELNYFGMEHLGIGNYPRPEGEDWVIPSADWLLREDQTSEATTELLLTVDATTDMQWATISLGGYRSDGSIHFGVIAHERGTRWTVHRLAELAHELNITNPVLMDSKSPVAYLLAEYEQIGLDVHAVTPPEWADMTAWILAAGTERPEADATDWKPQFLHPGQPILTSSLAASKVRSRGDRVVLSRQTGDVPSSPFTSGALAAYGVLLLGREPSPPPAPELIETPSSGGWDRPDFAGMSF